MLTKTVMLGNVEWRPLLIAVRLAISFVIGDRCGFKLSLRHYCCLATGLLGWPARQIAYGFIKIYVVAEMLMDLILAMQVFLNCSFSILPHM